MSAYDLPSGAPFDAAGNWTTAWAQWLTRTHGSVITLQQSGPTTQRPIKLLWVGRFYYDTTLNKPIWLNAINPVVWRDAAGIAV
jgi:hypothetical protein